MAESESAAHVDHDLAGLPRGAGVYERPDGRRAKIAALVAAVTLTALALAMFLLLRRA